MTTSPSSNFHTLSQMILWQYEHSPNIVRWIRELSATGYATCGMVFDDIIGGIVEILSAANSIGMWIAQTLIASKGFDWKDSLNFSVVGREAEFLRAFYYSRFIGVGNLEEFYQTLRTFGHVDVHKFNDVEHGVNPVDMMVTDPDGALRRLDNDVLAVSRFPTATPIGERPVANVLARKGMPIPLSVYSDWRVEDEESQGLECFQFGKGYSKGGGNGSQNMRLCTDDEKSFYKIRQISPGSTTALLSDVANGNILARRRNPNAE